MSFSDNRIILNYNDTVIRVHDLEVLEHGRLNTADVAFQFRRLQQMRNNDGVLFIDPYTLSTIMNHHDDDVVEFQQQHDANCVLVLPVCDSMVPQCAFTD